jgi:hypothetical protein
MTDSYEGVFSRSYLPLKGGGRSARATGRERAEFAAPAKLTRDAEF